MLHQSWLSSMIIQSLTILQLLIHILESPLDMVAGRAGQVLGHGLTRPPGYGY